MKLTKRQLQRIIREELEAVLEEEQTVGSPGEKATPVANAALVKGTVGPYKLETGDNPITRTASGRPEGAPEVRPRGSKHVVTQVKDRGAPDYSLRGQDRGKLPAYQGKNLQNVYNKLVKRGNLDAANALEAAYKANDDNAVKKIADAAYAKYPHIRRD